MKSFTYQVKNADGENVRLDTLNETIAWEPKNKGETAEVIEVQELEPSALERINALIEDLKSKAETERGRIMSQSSVGVALMKKAAGKVISGTEKEAANKAELALKAVDDDLAKLLARLVPETDTTTLTLPDWAQG